MVFLNHAPQPAGIACQSWWHQLKHTCSVWQQQMLHACLPAHEETCAKTQSMTEQRQAGHGIFAHTACQQKPTQ
jgi:hypothetical protein